MATVNVTPVAAASVGEIYVPATTAEPGPRRFNVDEYYRMAEVGILRPEDRVELIRGAIVQMNPIGIRHAECTDRLNEILVLAFTKQAKISVGNPVRLDSESEPQPDFAILKLRNEPRTAHPGPDETLVAIEVSDTSLRYDRNVKAPLYAEAGIPEFWIVDLGSDSIEVRRRPTAGNYAELQVLHRGDQLRCAAFPDTALDVAAILG